MGKMKWYIKATYVILGLAFVLGMAMLPETPSLAHGPYNPDFEAFPRFGDAPLEVRFENWMYGGTLPYVKAEWDFGCDGVIETTLTGTHAEVMADVTWTYPLPGLYTVCLTMTDSTPPPLGPFVHTETKIGYITVLFEDPWVYDANEDGTVEKSEVILAVQHYFDGRITKAQAIEVAMLYFHEEWLDNVVSDSSNPPYSDGYASVILRYPNNPPNTPSTPSGQDLGYAGISYSYSTSATDPDGDQVKYTFDWGDGSSSETGLVDSGTIASESHTWSSTWSQEIYYIKAKATDSEGASSGWSDSRPVTMPMLCYPNADFEALPREGKAPLEILFENWTTGGLQPFVKAEWDFDGDGEAETTLTGTHEEVMADVTWTYNLPGVYTVCLTMTDSTPEPAGPLVGSFEKIAYITVLFDPWAYDGNQDGVIQKTEVIHAIQDYSSQNITKAQAIEVAMLYFG